MKVFKKLRKDPRESFSTWANEQYSKTFKVVTLLVILIHPVFHFIFSAMKIGTNDSLLNRVIASLSILTLYLLSISTDWGKKHTLKLFQFSILTLLCSTFMLVFCSNNHPLYSTASTIVIIASGLCFYSIKDYALVLWPSYIFLVSINYFYAPYENFINTIFFFTPIFMVSQAIGIPKINLHIQQFKINQLLQTQKDQLNEALNYAQNVKEEIIQQTQIILLGKITAGLSHEMNNPLMISNTIINKVSADISNDQFNLDYLKRHINKVQNANSRMHSIITNMKMVSRRFDDVQIDDIEFKTFWENLLMIFDPIRVLERADFTYNEVPDVKFSGNQSKLIIAILNVLINALEFLPESGERWVKVNFTLQKENIYIDIMNSGHSNIADDEIIFLPFYSTKEIGKGLGLGLSVTKGILETYKGKIELLNNEDFTTFRITFPVVK